MVCRGLRRIDAGMALARRPNERDAATGNDPGGRARCVGIVRYAAGVAPASSGRVLGAAIVTSPATSSPVKAGFGPKMP